jgi:hypothetical protein
MVAVHQEAVKAQGVRVCLCVAGIEAAALLFTGSRGSGFVPRWACLFQNKNGPGDAAHMHSGRADGSTGCYRVSPDKRLAGLRRMWRR